jgi:hypothetical protein
MSCKVYPWAGSANARESWPLATSIPIASSCRALPVRTYEPYARILASTSDANYIAYVVHGLQSNTKVNVPLPMRDQIHVVLARPGQPFCIMITSMGLSWGVEQAAGERRTVLH